MRRLLILFAVVPGLASAAIPTRAVSGKLLQPDGTAAASGAITCQLSQAGSVLDGATWQRVAGQAVGTVAADGTVTMSMVPNDVISPSGTAYLCSFSTRATSGRPVSWTETWQVATGAGSIDIGAITRVAAGGVTYVAGPVGPGDTSPVTATGSTTAITLANRFAKIRTAEDFGAMGNDTNDDLVSIQSGINTLSSEGGGILRLGPKVYRVTAAPLMKSNVWLMGAGARVLYQATGATWWTRGGQLGLAGTVLHQVTAGADGILVQNQDGTGAPLYGVGITDLAIAFGASVNSSPQAAGIATGHGINVKPPVTGAGIRNSVVGANIARVITYGHDGNHYGWRLEGANTSTFGQLISYGGGGLLFKAPDGNSSFPGMIQVFWQNPGTAHGIHFDGVGSAALNINFFAYLQSNSDFGVGGSAPASFNFKWNALAGGNIIGQFDVEAFSGTTAGMVSGDGTELTVLGGNSAPGLTVISGNSSGSSRGVVVTRGLGPASAGAFILRSDVTMSQIGGSANVWYRDFTGMEHYSGTAFGSLGTPANGSFTYCTDCTLANPCAGGGTGAFAKRLNGAWVCN